MLRASEMSGCRCWGSSAGRGRWTIFDRVPVSEITSRAIASAKLTGEQIVSTAKAEADAMREKASREIELERRKTMDELKGEISGLAVEIASKVAEKEIGEKEHEALIGKFIDELGEGS